MKTYVGSRDEDGVTVVIEEDGKGTRPLPLKPSLKVWNHSPTGFEFGYAGSGPAQLALALLLEHGVPAEEAVQLHQQIKRDVVAKLNHEGWCLTDAELGAAIENIRAQT